MIVATHPFPEGFSVEGLDADDADFASLASFRHALSGFQGVDVVAVDTAVSDADALFEGVSIGRSTAGRRRVTGSEDPAKKGNPGAWRLPPFPGTVPRSWRGVCR